MGKYLAIFLGIVSMIAGIYLVIFVWWREFYELVFGFIPPILFFGGLIAVVAGISSIKDTIRQKRLEAEASVLQEEQKTEEKKD
jgi:hypothetical protein